MYHQQ